jgi:hypothetical protein
MTVAVKAGIQRDNAEALRDRDTEAQMCWDGVIVTGLA